MNKTLITKCLTLEIAEMQVFPIYYNNVLTLATKNVKFGANENVNYVKPIQQKEKEVVSPTPLKKVPIQTNDNISPTFPKIDKTTYLLGSMATLGFVVAKYVI